MKDEEKAERRRLLNKVLWLGLIFTLAWATLLSFVTQSPILTILDYVMYFMSVFIVALPTYNVLKLYIRNSINAIFAAALIWAAWIGVKYLFMWLMGMFRVL